MKKPVKLGLWLLGFAVLGMMGLWLEHERAKARLTAFKAQLIAKGEKLTFRELAEPPPKPGDDGAPDFFRAAERLPRLPDFDAKLFRPHGMRLIAPGRARIAWRTQPLPTEGLRDEVIEDLWPDWIAYVETQRSLLAEVRAALEKPAFAFTNFHTTDGFPLGKSTALRASCSWLEGAALDSLRAERLPDAWADLRAATRIYQRWTHGHLLITTMIYDSGMRSLFQTTWDALQHSGWTEAQLAEWQQLWQTLPCLPVVVRGFEGERAYVGASYHKLRTQPTDMSGLGIRINPFILRGQDWLEPFAEKPGETLHDIARASVWPLWNSYPDERLSLERFQFVLNGWRACASDYSFAAGAAHRTRAEVAGKNISPWLLVSHSEIGFPGSQDLRFARMEVERQMVVTALALRRHKLRHGRYPDSLRALVPAFLTEMPRDFMDGQSMRYQLQPIDTFRLWSVGTDGKDDQGDATPGRMTSRGNPFDWNNCRDWVWPQPATEAEVSAYHADLAARRARKTPP